MRLLSHIEIIENCYQGNTSSRIPIAFWRHFPVDDQRADTLARATFEFQKQFDFDLVKISPSSSFCLRDWGIRDTWKGHPEGVREYINHPFSNYSKLEKLKPLNPNVGSLGSQLDCCRMLRKDIKRGTPLIQTIFSPISQLKNLVGKKYILHILREHSDLAMHALRTITQTTLEWIQLLYSTGVDAVYYAAQLAESTALNADEYRIFGKPFDMQILGACHDFQLNLLHIHGEDVLFDEFVDYPVHIINWDQSTKEKGLSYARTTVNAMLCGGLDRIKVMLLADAKGVQAAFIDAINQTNGIKFILGSNCVLMQATPIGNILTAIDLAHNSKKYELS